MKKTIRAALFAAAIFSLSANSFAQAPAAPAPAPTQSAPATAGQYTNAEKGFSINFPANWEQRPNAAGSLIAALSPQDGPTDNFRENVNIVTEDLPKPYTAEEYYQAGLNSLKTLPNFVQHQKGTLNVNGKEMIWIEASHRSSNVPARMIQYYLTNNKRAYILTCTALETTLEKYKAQCNQIASTFKVQ